MKKIALSIIIGLIVAACAGSKVVAPLANPTQADVDRNKTIFANLELQELVEGKALFETNCVKCHKIKHPTSRSVEKWQKVVPRMAKKAKVDAKTQDLILKYVVSMSSAK